MKLRKFAQAVLADTASPQERRLAAMFAGDDDSLVAVQNEGGKK